MVFPKDQYLGPKNYFEYYLELFHDFEEYINFKLVLNGHVANLVND